MPPRLIPIDILTCMLYFFFFFETGSLKRSFSLNEVIWMGPNPTGLVSLLEEEIQTQRSMEGPCEDAGRRWPSTSQGESPSEETNNADTLISNFWPPELRISLCFKPLTLLMAALPTPPSLSLFLSLSHTNAHTACKNLTSGVKRPCVRA